MGLDGCAPLFLLEPTPPLMFEARHCSCGRCKQRSRHLMGHRRSVFEDGTGQGCAKDAPRAHMTRRLPLPSMLQSLPPPPLSTAAHRPGLGQDTLSIEGMFHTMRSNSQQVLTEAGCSTDRDGRLCVLAASRTTPDLSLDHMWPHALAPPLDRSKERTRERTGRKRSVFQDGTEMSVATESPESHRLTSRLPRPSQLPSPLAGAPGQQLSPSARSTSLPIRHVRRGAALTGEKLPHALLTAELHKERAATRVQAAMRGRLIRNLRLTRLAAAEQHAAIARLRARGRGGDPGQGALPAGIGCNQRRISMQTVKC